MFIYVFVFDMFYDSYVHVKAKLEFTVCFNNNLGLETFVYLHNLCTKLFPLIYRWYKTGILPFILVVDFKTNGSLYVLVILDFF